MFLPIPLFARLDSSHQISGCHLLWWTSVAYTFWAFLSTSFHSKIQIFLLNQPVPPLVNEILDGEGKPFPGSFKVLNLALATVIGSDLWLKTDQWESASEVFLEPIKIEVDQLVKNLPAMWETWVQSLGWEDSLEKGKATHSSILAWRIPWTV